jgi:hypothetical protein
MTIPFRFVKVTKSQSISNVGGFRYLLTRAAKDDFLAPPLPVETILLAIIRFPVMPHHNCHYLLIPPNILSKIECELNHLMCNRRVSSATSVTNVHIVQLGKKKPVLLPKISDFRAIIKI